MCNGMRKLALGRGVSFMSAFNICACFLAKWLSGMLQLQYWRFPCTTLSWDWSYIYMRFYSYLMCNILNDNS